VTIECEGGSRVPLPPQGRTRLRRSICPNQISAFAEVTVVTLKSNHYGTQLHRNY
jgi:hypothetical protein